MLDRIIAADQDPSLGRFNEHRIRFYLESFRRRRRLSLIQIQCAIKFIDHFFDQACEPGSQVRKSLRMVLGFIDS